MQQIGSGIQGLGIGSFGLDWETISSYMDTPLVALWPSIDNVISMA